MEVITMDCPISVRFANALSFLTSISQQHAIRYLAALEARNYADGTLSSIVSALKSLTRLVSESRRGALIDDLSQTTSQDITEFISAAQKAGLAPSTINLKLSLLSEFFEFLRQDGLMTQQPIFRRRHRLLTPTTLPKPMEETDLVAFFKVVDSVRDRLIFLLMLRCGLRVSEVCALTWDAIDFNDGTARINNGKGQVDRIVYFSPDVEQALKTWQAYKDPDKYLFPSRKRKGLPITRKIINEMMNGYLETANITKHYSPHCLRHAFATELLNAGVPLEALKELMGHHSIHVTLRYTQLYDTTKRQQYDQAMAKVEQRQAINRR
jgi:integrase/recombinase XerD